MLYNDDVNTMLYVVSGHLKRREEGPFKHVVKIVYKHQLYNPYHSHKFWREYCTFLLHKLKRTSSCTCLILNVTLDIEQTQSPLYGVIIW